MQVFGQVYIPVVNYVLMALTMIVVGTFQTSARLGNAYGTSAAAHTCPQALRIRQILLGQTLHKARHGF